MNRQVANKKGISPLIATVLMLAFAVAVGTMLVSYFLDSLRHDPCKGVEIRFDEICYKEGMVRFIVINDGTETITNMQARLLSQTKDPFSVPLVLTLIPGDASRIELPFETLDPSTIVFTLTPKVTSDSKELFCSKAELKVPITTCV